MSIYKKSLRDLRLASIDTETTGLDPKKGRIVELGIVYFENGIPVERYCKLFNTSVQIDPRASKKTGITNEDLVGKKTFGELGRKIIKRLYDADAWIMFNDTFDRGFLHEEFKRNKLEFNDKPCIDPLIMANYIWPSGPNNLDAVIQKTRTKAPNKIVEELGFCTTRHRADYDALMSGMVLFNIFNILPERLDHILIVQNWMYNFWFKNTKHSDKKYQRVYSPTLPEE